MKFRPCIDIHNGKVKQIVGGSLQDSGDKASVNYISAYEAKHYAQRYKEDQIQGGHIILLNPSSSSYYTETKSQALAALRTYPQGLQIGGGITCENAMEYIEAGASHVIVTSYIFKGETLQWGRLQELVETVGKERLVLDLSCRRREDKYYIVTNRWQTYTNVELSSEVLDQLSQYCDEFLIHGVDVEGKSAGVDENLVKILANWSKKPITYAGGIGSLEDLKLFQVISKGKLDFTIGSALDLFGGPISYAELVKINKTDMETM